MQTFEQHWSEYSTKKKIDTKSAYGKAMKLVAHDAWDASATEYCRKGCIDTEASRGAYEFDNSILHR